MSLACSFDNELDDPSDYAWIWEGVGEIKPLGTKRSRRCQSCKRKITVGENAAEIARWRAPKSDIEMKIYGEDGQVYISPWWYCDKCANQAAALEDLGFTWNMSSDCMADLIKEYNVIYQANPDTCANPT